MTAPDPNSPPENLEAIARRAYEAYGYSAEWITHDRRSMPGWSATTEATRKHWAAAVREVLGAAAEAAPPRHRAAPSGPPMRPQG